MTDDNTTMHVDYAPQIVAVDKLLNRIVVAFDDGQCVLFSAELLHAIIPRAQVLGDPEKDTN